MDFELRQLEAYLQQQNAQITSLASEQLPQHLHTPTIHLFNMLPSTNQMMWELIEQGAREGTVAIALQQQAGRGQWGRQWQSPLGGLYLSLALLPNVAAEISGQLTLCIAWGIATSLRNHGAPVGLKWPNDLVVDRRKLGGILIETRVQQGRVQHAVVGVGINWVNPVSDPGINLKTVLANQPQPAITSLEMLAAIAIHGIMTGYHHWRHDGIETMLPSYETLLTSMGQTVTLDDCLGEVTGISASGDLRVRVYRQDNPAIAREVSLKPGMVSLGYGNAGTKPFEPTTKLAE